MAEHDDQSDKDALIRQIFYLLTAKFEDGAAAAADGQANGQTSNAQAERANRLHALAQEAMILTATVMTLSGN
jgi:hypothetical protein